MYTSVDKKKWRVKPDPENYANDIGFPWKNNPKKAWNHVLAFCKNPRNPDDLEKIKKGVSRVMLGCAVKFLMTNACSFSS